MKVRCQTLKEMSTLFLSSFSEDLFADRCMYCCLFGYMCLSGVLFQHLPLVPLRQDLSLNLMCVVSWLPGS